MKESTIVTVVPLLANDSVSLERLYSMIESRFSKNKKFLFFNEVKLKNQILKKDMFVASSLKISILFNDDHFHHCHRSSDVILFTVTLKSGVDNFIDNKVVVNPDNLIKVSGIISSFIERYS